MSSLSWTEQLTAFELRKTQSSHEFHLMVPNLTFQTDETQKCEYLNRWKFIIDSTHSNSNIRTVFECKMPENCLQHLRGSHFKSNSKWLRPHLNEHESNCEQDFLINFTEFAALLDLIPLLTTTQKTVVRVGSFLTLTLKQILRKYLTYFSFQK